MMGSFYDKLKALGVNIGMDAVTPPSGGNKRHKIEDVIEGAFVQTPFGEVYQVQKIFPYQHNHGRGEIGVIRDLDFNVIARWAQVDKAVEIDPAQIAFMDIETSGLSGGTGTIPFQVGIGYFTGDGFLLSQLFLRSPDEESALLAQMTRLMDPIKAIVTYNGKSFDIPVLNTRHVLNGISSPFTSLHHFDLLHLSRRLWRDSLPSRRLSDIERDILGVARTGEEVPGWMVPQYYFDYLRTGDARPLGGVFYHNEVDILSLVSLFNHAAALLNDPLSSEKAESLELAAIARLYEELGEVDHAFLIYEQSLQLGLPDSFYMKTLQQYAALNRKYGNWEEAVRLWTSGADQGHVISCVELSKYYEHRQRDYAQAARWAEEALKQIKGNIASSAYSGVSAAEVLHRLERLARKLEKGSKTQ